MTAPSPPRPKLTLGKPLPPAAAKAIARVSGADLAAAALARRAPPAAAKPAPASPPRVLKDPPPTKLSAERQRHAWRAADLLTCRERFPGVFDPERPLPLAIGVHTELGKVLGSKRAKRLLDAWTRSRAYVAAVAAGGLRYNLDGTEAGPIDARHQALARAAAEPRREAA